jgi:HK97 family phage major capsid protein
MSTEIKTAIEALGRDWEAFKNANAELVKAKADAKSVVDIEAKIDRINAALGEADATKAALEAERKAQARRIDELEAALSNPRPMTAEDQVGKKHRDLFSKWLRSKGNNTPEAAELAAFERLPEAKAISTAASATGGYAVPEDIARQIIEREELLSPVRSLVKVVTAGTPDYKELVAIHGAASAMGGWVGETDSRTETGTATLRERAPTFGMLYAYPKATEESLNDVFFNVENFVIDHAALAFAQLEGIALLTGNGTKKPTGLLNTTPVATDDGSPERAAAALEYIPLSIGVSPNNQIAADGITDLVYGLRAGYRAGASFAMNSLTVGKVRKLKDTTGQYLWQPSLQAGVPSTLLGYPIAILEDLANVAVNALPILFGNFQRAYVLVDLVGFRMTVDEITTPGYVKWYLRRRVGGCILDNNALKVGKCSDS